MEQEVTMLIYTFLPFKSTGRQCRRVRRNVLSADDRYAMELVFGGLKRTGSELWLQIRIIRGGFKNDLG